MQPHVLLIVKGHHWQWLATQVSRRVVFRVSDLECITACDIAKWVMRKAILITLGWLPELGLVVTR